MQYTLPVPCTWLQFSVEEGRSVVSPTLANVVEEGRDELTPAEAESLVEEQTQQYLGISAVEFRRRALADELPTDNPMVVHIALLAGVELRSC